VNTIETSQASGDENAGGQNTIEPTVIPSVRPQASQTSGPASDRGMPNLKKTQKKANVNRLYTAAVIVVALAVIALGGAIFVKRITDSSQQAKADAKAAPKEMDADAGHDFEVDAQRLARDKAAAAEQASMAARATAASMPAPSGASGAGGASAVGGAQTGVRSAGTEGPPAPHVQTLAERRLDGDVLIGQTGKPGDLAGKNGSKPGSGSDSARGDSPVPVRAAPGSLEDRLAPSQLASAKAYVLPDLDYLLKRGTLIPCGMRTPVITTYPGMTSCIVSQDVYSADGRTLLIERGSEAIGEQRNALMQGQARIFVVWSHIDMPNGVTVDVNSPGTDALGASGLDAYVDTHFWQRFGGALMLSLIGDVGQAISNKSLGSGNNQIQFSNTSSSGQSLADETLKNTVNIPPTAYSNQGAQSNIFVARNIDFKGIYDLQPQQ
jgi:type IV secretion system protein VirB10